MADLIISSPELVPGDTLTVGTAGGTKTIRISSSLPPGDYSLLLTPQSVPPPPVPLTISVDAGPDQEVSEGSAASFVGNAVPSQPGTMLSFLWDFGDGSQAAGTLTPQHVYDDDGVYAVRLTVNGPGGVSASDTLQVTVRNVLPSVLLGGPFTVRPGQSVAFTPNVVDPSLADAAAGFAYLWDFGDGTSSMEPAPAHVYVAAGIFTVTLQVTDKNGGRGTGTVSVSVEDRLLPPSSPSGNFIQTRFDHFPNFGENPTVRSVGSGNWSSPATWSPARMPVAGDVVSIGSGHTVLYDTTNSPTLRTVSVQVGGHLQWHTSVDTRVVVTNFLVLEGGRLTIGTPANPVAANVKAEVLIANTPLDLVNDPEQWGNSLIVLGTITTSGTSRGDSFVRLAAEPKAGQTTLSLAQPVPGWKAGDRIVLPDTHIVPHGISSESDFIGKQAEFLTIASVSADGRTITLTGPLQYDHLGARDANGRLDFLPHVGNLTRNVMIKSQSATGVRGIVVFTENADVDVRHTAFAGLGRTRLAPADNTRFDESGAVAHVGTNQEHRVSVQFRHIVDRGGAPGSRLLFEGNSIFCPLQKHEFIWGLALNDSQRGTFRNNFLYNWVSVAFVVYHQTNGPAPKSANNIIEKNFSVLVNSGGSLVEGAGFRFWGLDNYIRDNVSANAGTRDYEFFGGWNINVNSFESDILLEFARNEAYGGNSGLVLWHINDKTPAAPQNTFKDLHVWHMGSAGIGFGYASSNVTFDGFIARNDSQNPLGTGWTWGDYEAHNLVIRNSDIQGFAIGVLVPVSQRLSLTLSGDPKDAAPDFWFTIENTVLRNHINVFYTITADSSGDGRTATPKGLILRNVNWGRVPGDASFVLLGLAPSNLFLYSGVDAQGQPIASGWNYVVGDYIYLYDLNGDPNADYRVYFYEQAANSLLPKTQDGGTTVGSPEAGLTNSQNWAKYKIAFGNEVAPTNAIDGKSLGIGGLIAEFRD